MHTPQHYTGSLLAQVLRKPSSMPLPRYVQLHVLLSPWAAVREEGLPDNTGLCGSVGLHWQ